VEAALLWSAFVDNCLTPTQTATLAAEAAAWLEPMWPDDPESIEKVPPLLDKTRELLELRDRARAVVGDDGDAERQRSKRAVK
jgi:hypothetical protein